MSFRYGEVESSGSNRREFLKKIGVSCESLVCAEQVHGNLVGIVTDKDRGKGAFSHADCICGIDGLLTSFPGVCLAIFTADCLPVFLFDPVKKCVGLIHAGWRSSAGKILTAAVDLMRREFKSSPRDLKAAFGPAIRKCCYRVGDEFQDIFGDAVLRVKEDFYLDLALANKKELILNGLRQENLFDAGICTCCSNDTFFSYRRQGQACGRMMAVIMLRNNVNQ
jgi:hypothetical protein